MMTKHFSALILISQLAIDTTPGSDPLGYLIDAALRPYSYDESKPVSRVFMKFFEDENCDIDPVMERRGYWKNPDAKWDEYEVGGRYANQLMTYNGDNVNSEYVNKIDWDNENYKFVPDVVIGLSGGWWDREQYDRENNSVSCNGEVESWNEYYKRKFIGPLKYDTVAVVADCMVDDSHV